MPTATLMLLAVVFALSGHSVTAARAQPGDDPRSYRVAPGDRVSVVVFGQTDLSGESVIDGAYSIIVPLIGPVPVRGLALKEIEQRIAQRLAEGYVQKPVVSVRVTEPRPIYVVGDVKTSGSYPYRYGVSVMGAIALAGGFALPEPRSQAALQSQAVLRMDFLQADEKFRALEVTRSALTARRIRLEAQRDDRQAPDFAGVTAPEAASEHISQVVKGELQMHAFQMEALQAQIAMLKEQEPKLRTGQRFLKEQLESEQRQLELIQQHLIDYNSLLSSGLARRYTGIELQREEARNRGNIARLSNDISNNEILIGELGIRVQEARDAFQRRVRQELQETLQRLAEVEAALPSARTARELRRAQLGGGVDEADPAPRRTFSITRAGDQSSETFAVTESSMLEPGDILRVEKVKDGLAPSEQAELVLRLR